jgi:hypothetical protein
LGQKKILSDDWLMFAQVKTAAARRALTRGSTAFRQPQPATPTDENRIDPKN